LRSSILSAYDHHDKEVYGVAPMRSRSLIRAGLAALAVLASGYAQKALAQHSPPLARVGFLGPGLPRIGGAQHPVVSALRSTLSDLGYKEGSNLVVEERWQPANKTEWLPEAIADLERAKVNVIFALGAIPARALKAAGTTIPSVFIMVIPTAEFVSNIEKPEGSMTGFTIFDPNLPRQQLEIFKQTAPNARRVAFIGDEAVGQGPFKPHEDAARALGLEPLVIKLRAPQPDLIGAFDEIQRERVEGLVALAHPIIGVHRLRIGELATKLGLPTLFPTGMEDAAGVLTYGTDFAEAAKLATDYVVRILKGTKPGELPVQTVHRHTLVVNLKTAQALSINIPPEVLNAAAEIVK
jgi:putative tryptophan/tyrosine transport system substrate-binding protein